MTKTALGCAVGSMMILVAGTASAQNAAFGGAGVVMLSAERLFGLVHTTETQSMGGFSQSVSQDSVTLFTNPTAAASGYAWPRLALDKFISPGISIGGAAGVFYLSPSSGSIKGFLIAPRAGVVLNLSPGAAIWARGGLTYEYISSEFGSGSSSRSLSAFALTLEAPVAFAVKPGFWFLAGPTIDLGLGGSLSGGGSSIDTKYTDVGIQAGLLLAI